MKRFLVTITMAAAAMCASHSGARANIKPIEIRGHVIGEPTSAFLRNDREAQAQAEACRQSPAAAGCADLLAALDSGERLALTNSSEMDFILDRGKLVRLTTPVDDEADTAAADLAAKIGKRPRKSIIQAANNAGVKWENCLFSWDTSDAYITLYQDNDPSLQDRRPLLVVESRTQLREYTVSVKQLAAAQRHHNNAAGSPAD